MSSTIIIFDTSCSGHHLEYLHHIYEALANIEDTVYFVVPETFKDVSRKMIWSDAKNIIFDYITAVELKRLKGGYLKNRWKHAILASKYAHKHKANMMFFIELIVFMPFLPFLLKNTHISGILYRLVPYEWKTLTIGKKIKDTIELIVMAKSNLIKTIFCLNDSSCAAFYNRKFNTTKYNFIVDPVLSLNYTPKSIRCNIVSSSTEMIVLHFGGMTERKGTLVLLDAILSHKELWANKVYVFAGHVSNDIREKFYTKVSQLLLDNVNVKVIDDFCSYEQIFDLCYSCDCVVVPYKNVSYSSGLIGYAAKFGKTVVGPNAGLLGKLIKRYNLGIGIEVSSDNLAMVLQNESVYKDRACMYANINTVSTFAKTVSNSVTKRDISV